MMNPVPAVHPSPRVTLQGGAAGGFIAHAMVDYHGERARENVSGPMLAAIRLLLTARRPLAAAPQAMPNDARDLSPALVKVTHQTITHETARAGYPAAPARPWPQEPGAVFVEIAFTAPFIDLGFIREDGVVIYLSTRRLPEGAAEFLSHPCP